ncbi:hypothetical protein OH76DRAFT_94274 [Lentinus brumalis]|uniref:Uncharacterized protein n=1 Tax=Lentinus brumalis TaxID=2498619 RepID=A0A371CQL8_9APHY|nr:hypothetical protein OH76DRAFT_94274 [Polyporus brumalis]
MKVSFTFRIARVSNVPCPSQGPTMGPSYPVFFVRYLTSTRRMSLKAFPLGTGPTPGLSAPCGLAAPGSTKKALSVQVADQNTRLGLLRVYARVRNHTVSGGLTESLVAARSLLLAPASHPRRCPGRASLRQVARIRQAHSNLAARNDHFASTYLVPAIDRSNVQQRAAYTRVTRSYRRTSHVLDLRLRHTTHSTIFDFEVARDSRSALRDAAA